MDTKLSVKELLQETTTEPEVFQDMDAFELTDAEKFALSIRLQFPKFSKGFLMSDFDSFIETHIGLDNLVCIGRLAFPNEWQMQVKSKEIREKLIRLGRIKINMRSCWISPLSPSEIRGFVHWVPNAVGQKPFENLLQPFGEVLFLETQKQPKWTKVNSDSRYFGLLLKSGRTMHDLPHFTKIEGHIALMTVKGRKPVCFHCKKIGHRKSDCKEYCEKLSDYCLKPPNPNSKNRKRGNRHKPSIDIVKDNSNVKTNKRKKKHNKATAEIANVIDFSSKVTIENIKTPVAHAAASSKQKENTLPKGSTSVATKGCINPDIGKEIDVIRNCVETLSLALKKTSLFQNVPSETTVETNTTSGTNTNTGTNVTAESVATADTIVEAGQNSEQKKKKRKKKKKKSGAADA